MIELTKLNGEKYIINSELIEMIEILPDTLVTMTNGRTHYVREPANLVIAKISEYKASVMVQASIMEEKMALAGKATTSRRRHNERIKEE